MEIRQARQVSGSVIGAHEAQKVSASRLFRGLLPPPDKIQVRIPVDNTCLLFDRAMFVSSKTPAGLVAGLSAVSRLSCALKFPM